MKVRCLQNACFLFQKSKCFLCTKLEDFQTCKIRSVCFQNATPFLYWSLATQRKTAHRQKSNSPNELLTDRSVGEENFIDSDIHLFIMYCVND
jgi:hypothetical protein